MTSMMVLLGFTPKILGILLEYYVKILKYFSDFEDIFSDVSQIHTT